MALDREGQLMRFVVQARIGKDVSEKLGTITRDLKSFIKELNFSKIEETQLQDTFIDMIAEECEGFCDKMRKRIAITPQNKTTSE